MKIKLYQAEVAFELPRISKEQLDGLHDIMAKEYVDVVLVRENLCNPNLIVFTWPNIPTAAQIKKIDNKITEILAENDNRS